MPPYERYTTRPTFIIHRPCDFVNLQARASLEGVRCITAMSRNTGRVCALSS